MIKDMVQIECDMCGLTTFANKHFAGMGEDELDMKEDKHSWICLELMTYYLDNIHKPIKDKNIIICPNCQRKIRAAFPKLLPED